MGAALRIFPATAVADECPLRVRGVVWVLEWALAITALGFASVALLEFGFRLAAERALVQAASAGLREAALPRATDRSVEAVILRQLGGHSRLSSDVRVGVGCDGAPVRGAIRANGNVRLVVNLAVPSESIMPRWLQAISPWKIHSEQTVWVAGQTGTEDH